MLASQRIETVMGGWFFSGTLIEEVPTIEEPTKRGATPTAIEWLILAWVGGKF